MKTLDEVIKALEICTSGYCSNRDGDCPYLNIDNDCDTRLRKLDALYHLNKYRMTLDDIVAKRKVLEYKTAQYEQMCETVQKQGQEHEDRLQAEIARYLEAVKNCEDVSLKAEKVIIDAVRNDPLTWDELKQMIDSIVWLEWSSDGKWVEIIRGFDDRIEYYRFGTDEFFYITKEEYVPDKWQAYRKERDS